MKLISSDWGIQLMGLIQLLYVKCYRYNYFPYQGSEQKVMNFISKEVNFIHLFNLNNMISHNFSDVMNLINVKKKSWVSVWWIKFIKMIIFINLINSIKVLKLINYNSVKNFIIASNLNKARDGFRGARPPPLTKFLPIL